MQLWQDHIMHRQRCYENSISKKRKEMKKPMKKKAAAKKPAKKMAAKKPAKKMY